MNNYISKHFKRTYIFNEKFPSESTNILILHAIDELNNYNLNSTILAPLIPIDLLYNREFCLELVSRNGDFFKNILIKNDYEIALKAIRYNPEMFLFVDKELKKNYYLNLISSQFFSDRIQEISCLYYNDAKIITNLFIYCSYESVGDIYINTNIELKKNPTFIYNIYHNNNISKNKLIYLWNTFDILKINNKKKISNSQLCKIKKKIFIINNIYIIKTTMSKFEKNKDIYFYFE